MLSPASFVLVIVFFSCVYVLFVLFWCSGCVLRVLGFAC
jgi:hypothetical protein